MIVEYSELRKPNTAKKSKNLSTNLTNYTLGSLYYDRDYYVRVSLCTKIGCKVSDWRYIAHLPSTAGREFTTFFIHLKDGTILLPRGKIFVNKLSLAIGNSQYMTQKQSKPKSESSILKSLFLRNNTFLNGLHLIYV